MTQNPITQLKRTALVYAILGVLVVLVGIKYHVHLCLLPLAVGLIAYFFLTRAFGILMRANSLDRDQMKAFQQAFQRQFARENLPRQIFWLLLAVAEVDGQSGEKERELVRSFLLQRFTDPATAHDLRAWEASRIPPEQVEALALHLTRILSLSERETVFSWCCLVAFADDNYTTEEHIVLQQIARAFDFAGHHARRIFHYAKNVHMRGESAGAGYGGGGAGSGSGYGYEGGYGGQGSRRPRGAVNDRAHALRVLGLEGDVSHDEVRKRHRELVREFHPDRHQHLGEVAAKEAEERFREVQAAYEVLGG